MVSRLVTVVSHLPDHLSGVRRDTRLARLCFYHVLLPPEILHRPLRNI